jgi:outer membrane protein OmpA-like peptidoglycan-associated protein
VAIAASQTEGLERAAQWILDTPDAAQIEVRGFARDNAGKRELIVATQRAMHVYEWLVAHGVPAKRIVPRGFANMGEDGEAEPAVVFAVVTPDQEGCCRPSCA